MPPPRTSRRSLRGAPRPVWQHVLTGFAIGIVLMLAALPLQARAQGGPAADGESRTQWWAALEACDFDDKPSCDRAVALAATLFDRLDRNVATTWVKVCLMGDMDRCEIGYRRFRKTGFTERDRPVSHLFARMACFGGMPDLCRPWDDFDTVDEGKRALVMADVCMQGARPNTCYRALGWFRDRRGFYNQVTYDLSKTLCERYQSGSACRVWAQVLEKNWDYRGAHNVHKLICGRGMRESCTDEARLRPRIEYMNRQAQREMEARMAAQARQATADRRRLSGMGYTSPGRVRTPITPFGSSARDIRNWNNYNEALRCGNPTATGC